MKNVKCVYPAAQAYSPQIIMESGGISFSHEHELSARLFEIELEIDFNKRILYAF